MTLIPDTQGGGGALEISESGVKLSAAPVEKSRSTAESVFSSGGGTEVGRAMWCLWMRVWEVEAIETAVGALVGL